MVDECGEKLDLPRIRGWGAGRTAPAVTGSFRCLAHILIELDMVLIAAQDPARDEILTSTHKRIGGPAVIKRAGIGLHPREQPNHIQRKRGRIPLPLRVQQLLHQVHPLQVIHD
jgi:hypothetical protein